MTQTIPPTVGIIDIGSNSVRMVCYDLKTGHPFRFYNEKETCSLGLGLEETGKLSPEGRILALQTIKGFAKQAGMLGINSIHAIATEAVRQASDGQDFIDDVKKATDIDIIILSGEEEAQYSAKGVLSSFPNGKGLVADLGGGSLELAVLDGQTIAHPLSLPLGVLRQEARIDDTGAAIRDIFESYKDVYAGSDTLYAVGGSWRALSEAHQRYNGSLEPHSHGYQTSMKDLKAFFRDLPTLDLIDLVRNYGVPLKRASHMKYAADTIKALSEVFGVQKIIISNAGLRDGVIYNILGK